MSKNDAPSHETFPGMLRDLNKRIAQIERLAHHHGVTTTAWTAITFQNSWASTGAVAAAYRRVGDLIYLRGAMTGNAAVAGSVAFTLPVGFRPVAEFNTATLGGANSYAAIKISTAGACTMPLGDKDWCSLDLPPFSITL